MQKITTVFPYSMIDCSLLSGIIIDLESNE